MMVTLKHGYKTTEFWATSLVTVGALIASLADKLPPRYAVYAGMASQGAYALSRGLTKLGALLSTRHETTVVK
jgi:hypothetical protein